MYRSSLIKAVALVAAALFAASTTGGASASSQAPLPHTPVGQQLAWVIGEVNGGSSSLTVTEVERHLAPSLRVALPASQFLNIAKGATSAYAPIRFSRFTSRPSATSAIALLKSRSGTTLAIYISLDARAPHHIKALDVSPRPITGPSTMKTVGRYTGRFDIGGGRKMYLRCAGSGTRTVVLEAGADGGADAWFAVQSWLATTTRVCSYDRANVPGGSSDPAPKPQTAAKIVHDLHDLLKAAHVPGPYVFVGHSNGGLFARLYATSYPKQVRGLVLIDTGNYPAMLNRLYKKMMSQSQWHAYQSSQRRQPPFLANAADEQVDLTTSYRQLAAAQRRNPLPRMPLVVISRGIPDPAMGAEVVPGINSAIENGWQQMQVKLATLVPGGKRIVATKSGHMITTEQPGIIVEAIRGVLAKIDAR